METALPSASNQWITATAQTIDQTFNNLKERVINAAKFLVSYRLELVLFAFVTFFVLFLVYVLFLAPPIPPCKDIY
ncbi:hypothetical protein [Mucilaginibacter polytrichastri]|uniref:Uncharacterized protein n=1 Tax=Mucilaginibacter polytrichastri TaxID=1302689 RepID=A0A1Q5ZVU4_9SPHI|nr:hypothetical protein [Mucilaginibacter polytrichastri]OKS85892.1 hypothetical protein RG47T_1338 [Mucilaginibacter polytrichastri]SFS60773.1 hypothetical protein SAMN04487890_102242 [Mucilaginibacter polytrichastri]